MATPPPPPPAGVVGTLRRRWPVVTLTAIVGLVLGALASLAVPVAYTSASAVSLSSARSISMATERQVVMSGAVAEASVALLAPRYRLTAEEVQAATSVTVPDDSLVMRIGFTAGTPQQAAAGADAVSEAYLMTRRADASAERDRLVATATRQIAELQTRSTQPLNSSAVQQRSIQVQVDALSTQLARLANVDPDPAQIINTATPPSTASGPGLLELGAAGGLIGLLIGIAWALFRTEDHTHIGGPEGLAYIEDGIVLDGTQDGSRADTWDIAAFMLRIPDDLGTDGFLLMVDADSHASGGVTVGQELVDALTRQGRTARFVDAGGINRGKISRGWPTAKKRGSWAGGVVVLDTTSLDSDAHKIALATRSDSVVLARSTADDAASLRRLVSLLRSRHVDLGLTALFPPRRRKMSIRR